MRPMRVLLVDDEAALREVLREGLPFEGFEVVLTCHGEEALAALRRGERFDTLVVDEEMPSLKGRELIDRLRSEGCRLPIVLVSGSLHLGQAECARLGIGPVLLKPFSFDQLARAIRAALPNQPATKPLG